MIANSRATDLLEISRERLSKHPLAATAPEMLRLIERANQTPERAINEQVRIWSNSARQKTLLVRVSAQISQHSNDDAVIIEGYVITFDDITDLLSAQRKAAWADVARRIAHEMKNPLTPIQLSAERLRRKYSKEINSDPETFSVCIDTIIRHVEDIGRMVSEFSSFARMPAPIMQTENMQDMCQKAVFLLRQAHPEIDYQLHMPADRIDAVCDRRQISQALTNLLQNATDSISENQELKQKSQLKFLDETQESLGAQGRISLHLDVQNGNISLTVIDNGKGLPLSRDRLTEPYVTTRDKGTGLGLAIVKKIMEDHSGRLTLTDHWCDNRQNGHGAVVELLFPAKQALHKSENTALIEEE